MTDSITNEAQTPVGRSAPSNLYDNDTHGDTVVVTDGRSVLADGYGVVPVMVVDDPDLSIQAKALYAYLCAHAGGGQAKELSTAGILAALRTSRHSLEKYRRELVDAGFISVALAQTRNGRRAVYTLLAIRRAPQGPSGKEFSTNRRSEPSARIWPMAQDASSEPIEFSTNRRSEPSAKIWPMAPGEKTDAEQKTRSEPSARIWPMGSNYVFKNIQKRIQDTEGKAEGGCAADKAALEAGGAADAPSEPEPSQCEPAAFAALADSYPRPSLGASREKALRAWAALIEAGIEEAEIARAASLYAAAAKAAGRTARYTMGLATFLTANKGFATWSKPNPHLAGERGDGGRGSSDGLDEAWRTVQSWRARMGVSRETEAPYAVAFAESTDDERLHRLADAVRSWDGRLAECDALTSLLIGVQAKPLFRAYTAWLAEQVSRKGGSRAA